MHNVTGIYGDGKRRRLFVPTLYGLDNPRYTSFRSALESFLTLVLIGLESREWGRSIRNERLVQGTPPDPSST